MLRKSFLLVAGPNIVAASSQEVQIPREQNNSLQIISEIFKRKIFFFKSTVMEKNQLNYTFFLLLYQLWARYLEGDKIPTKIGSGRDQAIPTFSSRLSGRPIWSDPTFEKSRVGKSRPDPTYKKSRDGLPTYLAHSCSVHIKLFPEASSIIRTNQLIEGSVPASSLKEDAQKQGGYDLWISG